MKAKTLNITPSMDLVKLIGEISNLKGHACIAELIDNSIDAFINSESSQESRMIDIHIPSSHMMEKDTPLTVTDNGKGMNAEELENALTAGISSKTFDGQLGLFGIGFNVACATLGKRVSVRTSRAEMDHDLLATIDLDEIRKFRRKDKTTQIEYIEVDKTFDDSGTKIEISRFLPKAKSLLNIKRVQSELNQCYSSIINKKYNINISINEKALVPYVFCIWGKERYVTHKKHGKIYAFHEIKEKLVTEKYFSINDGFYIDDDEINDYDEKDLVKRPIIISGWLGIQRFLDRDNYGINVIRNGRVILKLEKDQFFKWKNRDGIDDEILEGYKYWDKNKEEMMSYPIDLDVMGGRIVGEIHANFIHPNPIKNKLSNEEDEGWLAALDEIKGRSPLQPQISEELGYEKNTSPLAILFDGYRKNSPVGKKTLLCGHSNKINANSKAKNIAQYFYDGKKEYQNDDKWYEMVVKAEINVDDDEEDVITDQFDDSDNTDITDNTNTTEDNGNSGNEIDDDPFNDAELLAEETYDIESFIDEKPIKVKIYEYKPDDDKSTKPISFIPDGLTKRKVYLNRNHDLFLDFADDWKDLVLLEVASIYQKLKIINNKDWQISEIYYELKKKYDSESMLNVKLLCSQAASLVDQIQENLVKNKEILDDDINHLLSDEELKSLKNNYIRRKKRPIKDIKGLVKDSSFLGYMDRSYIHKYITLHPEHIFNDKVFTLPYADLDEDIRDELLLEYMDSVNDVFWFLNKLSEVPSRAIIDYKDSIIRHRYGLNYLIAQIA